MRRFGWVGISLCSTLVAVPCSGQLQQMSADSEMASLGAWKIAGGDRGSEVLSPGTDSAYALIGKWEWGSCYAAAVKGSHVFVGNGSLLQVLDVTEPDTPKIVAELSTGQHTIGIAISGDYAFLLGDSFLVVDISDPTSPEIASRLSRGGTAFGLGGRYAFIGDFSGYISVVDVQDPLSPKPVTYSPASGEIVLSLAVGGNYLYASTYDGFVVDIFDFSDTADFRHVGTIGRGSAHGLAIQGNYLYLANWGDTPQFQIYDVSNGQSPTYVGGLDIAGYIISITPRDSLVYLARGLRGISILNVRDKANPVEVATKPPDVPFASPGRIVLDSVYAYSPSSVGMWVLNVEQPAAPSTVSFFGSSSQVRDLAVDTSHHAYLATANTGLQIIDLSNPSAPKLVGRHYASSEGHDVAYSDGKAFFLTRNDLSIIDVSNPLQPNPLGVVPFQDTLNDDNGYGATSSIAVVDTLAIVPRSSKRIYIIGVSLPNQPQVLGILAVPATPVDVAVSDGFMYVAEGGYAIEVYDISNPGYPRWLDSVRCDPRGIALQGNLLFAADEGFTVFDISSPGNPARRGNVFPAAGGMTMARFAPAGRFVHMAYNVHLCMVDVSNPWAPTIVGNLDDWSGLDNAAVSNDLVLYSGAEGGVTVLRNERITSVPTGPWNAAPKTVSLWQNYPNPFNPRTFIRYAIPERTHVRLTIFDGLGRSIITLVDQVQESGEHTVAFDAAGLATGVYFYRLETKYGSRVRLAILVK